MLDFREIINNDNKTEDLKELFNEQFEDFKQMYDLEEAVNEFKRILDNDFNGELFDLFNCGDLEYFVLPLYISWLNSLYMADNITDINFKVVKV